MKKGKEKRRKIKLKKGGKGLKNASFWAIISNRKLIGWGKNESKKRGGGNDQNAQYIFLPSRCETS